MKILSLLAVVKGWFSNGGAGNTVGNTLANGGAVLAVIAALAPAVTWIVEHKDETFLSLTVSYGWFSALCVIFAIYLKMVHYTRAGRPEDRGDGRDRPL